MDRSGPAVIGRRKFPYYLCCADPGCGDSAWAYQIIRLLREGNDEGLV